MQWAALTFALLVLGSTLAYSDTVTTTTTGTYNGVPSLITTTITITPLDSGKILLADNVSILLLAGSTSKLCRAGGC